jgi:hypothetical protein
MATDGQRDMAALLHGGPRSVLTGLAALRRHSGQARRTEMIDVLVPATTTRRDAGFARFHRTSRLPDRVCVAGEISFALPPRAVADAVRGLTDLREVRAIVSSVVQRGICPILRLAEELADGPVQGSARLRQALAEVADGVRSVAEADLRDLIAWAGLPVPLYNPRLFSGATFIAVPGCWWPDAGVVAEAVPEQSVSEQSAEAEEVEHAGLDLQAAAEPGPREAARVLGDGQQVLALGGEPDLGLAARAVGKGDRGDAVGPEPGHECHAEVVHLATDLAFHEVGSAVSRIHVQDPACEAFERLAAFLSTCHETPRFPRAHCPILDIPSTAMVPDRYLSSPVTRLDRGSWPLNGAGLSVPQQAATAMCCAVLSLRDGSVSCRRQRRRGRPSEAERREESTVTEPEPSTGGPGLPEPAGTQPAGPQPAGPRPTTGDARVDEAVARLGDLAGLPAAEHPPVFEHVHQRLAEALGDLDVRDRPAPEDSPGRPGI